MLMVTQVKNSLTAPTQLHIRALGSVHLLEDGSLNCQNITAMADPKLTQKHPDSPTQCFGLPLSSWIVNQNSVINLLTLSWN